MRIAKTLTNAIYRQARSRSLPPNIYMSVIFSKVVNITAIKTVSGRACNKSLMKRTSLTSS